MILRCEAVLFDLQSIAIASTYSPDALRAATFCVAALHVLEVVSPTGAVPIELGFEPT